MRPVDVPVGIGMSGPGVGLHPKAGRQPGQAGVVGGEGAEGDQAAGPRGQANQGPQRCVEFRLTPDDHVSRDEPGEDLGDRTDLETRVRGDRRAGPSAPARCRVPGAQIRWLVAATHEGSGTNHRTRDRPCPREALRRLAAQFGTGVRTIYSTRATIAELVKRADLLNGAVLVPGAAAPKL